VYPIVYGGVLAVQPVPVALLTARNIVTVVLLVMAVTALVRVPTGRGRRSPARTRDRVRLTSTTT